MLSLPKVARLHGSLPTRTVEPLRLPPKDDEKVLKGDKGLEPDRWHKCFSIQPRKKLLLSAKTVRRRTSRTALSIHI